MGEKPIGTRAPTAPLTVPNAAVPAFRDLLAPAYAAADHETVSNDLAMVSAPVVAAELRRIVGDHGRSWAIARYLNARADELDGGP